MRTSAKGVAFIEAHEGFVERAYRDPVGVLTIGTGFTNRSAAFRKVWGRRLRPGDRITAMQNREMLNVLLIDEYEPAVKNKMPADAKQHEFDAAVSAVFNLGGKFMDWTAARLWRSGERQAAANHWARNYNKAGGRVLRGLVRRRQEEAHLFLTGEYKTDGEGIQRHETQETPKAPDLVVKEAQQLLAARGFNPGAVDGWLGQKTKSALLAYQKVHPHLDNDGILGPATLAQLRRDALACKETFKRVGAFRSCPRCLPVLLVCRGGVF